MKKMFLQNIMITKQIKNKLIMSKQQIYKMT